MQKVVVTRAPCGLAAGAGQRTTLSVSPAARSHAQRAPRSSSRPTRRPQALGAAAAASRRCSTSCPLCALHTEFTWC